MTEKTKLRCKTCGWSCIYQGGTNWKTHSERLDYAEAGHKRHCPDASFSRKPLVRDGEQQ